MCTPLLALSVGGMVPYMEENHVCVADGSDAKENYRYIKTLIGSVYVVPSLPSLVIYKPGSHCHGKEGNALRIKIIVASEKEPMRMRTNHGRERKVVRGNDYRVRTEEK